MSGALTLSSAPFSDQEKADIRRFCGYPPYGAGQAGFQSWRFFQAYGLMEFRLNNMAAAEIQNIRFQLSNLYPVEAAVTAAYGTLNVDQAGPFKRNRAEVRDRVGHYSWCRRQLCDMVGVPPGPDLTGEEYRRVV